MDLIRGGCTASALGHPSLAGTAPSHQIEDYTGTYVHPGYGALEISAGDGDGTLAMDMGSFSAPLEHWHYDVWSADTSDPFLEGQKLLFRTDFDKRPASRLFDPDFLERFVGTYESSTGDKERIELSAGGLTLHLPGQPTYLLEPQVSGRFGIQGFQGISISFTDEEGGSREHHLLRAQRSLRVAASRGVIGPASEIQSHSGSTGTFITAACPRASAAIACRSVMRPVLRDRPQLAAYLPPLLLVALIMLVAWHRSGRELNPEILDQADYMGIGLMIAEGRGLTDGARSPLYPAMLAPVATRDHSYYASAKIVTLGLGLVVYLFLAWRIARRWGPGMATAVLLACGNTLVWTVSGLRVEVLMFPLLFVFWEAGTDGFERGSAWVVAGIAAGLFYLTKANGTVLVAAFILTWLLAGEWRSRRRWLLGLFLFPFAVVIAPLAIYNQVHFGAPLYNFNSHHAMWVDHWDELWVSKTPPPTFETWWAEHGWTDVIARELRGLLVLPDWHWFLIFLAVAVAAALRLRKERPRPEPDLERHGLTLATTVVVGHLVLLTWFAIVVSSVHHVMPLQPVMAVVIFSEVARSIPERWKLAAVKARPACTALLALVVLAAPFALDLRNLYSQPIRTYPEVEDWVRSGSDTCLTYGPSQNFPKWLFTPDFEFVQVPSDISLEELAQFMKERECRFLLVDAEAVSKRPVLEPLVLDDPVHGLIEATTDHGFRPHLLDPTVPREWVLFELETKS